MLAAAIAGGLGLAQPGFREMAAYIVLERVEARPLEYLDHEISSGLQVRTRERQCKLREPNASRLVDDVDSRKIGGHVGQHKVDRRSGERRFDHRDAFVLVEIRLDASHARDR